MKNILADKTIVNLIIGGLIILFLAIFSVWYFDESDPNVGNLDTSLLDELEFDENITEGQRTLITVEAGEGLWQIAERYCGEGELYDEIAAENGLSAWYELEVGQQLTVSCDY